MSIPFLVANYQTYVTALKRPTTSSWSGTATYGTHSNDNLAYDIVAGYENAINDTTETFATIACSARPRTSAGSANSTTIYSGFGTGAYNGAINISSSGYASSGINLNGDVIEDGELEISYSTTGVSGTYTSIAVYSNNGIEGVATWTKDRIFAYTGAVADRANIAVKIEARSMSSGSTISTHAAGASSVDVYDIILG
jgi:hypothetical protein